MQNKQQTTVLQRLFSVTLNILGYILITLAIFLFCVFTFAKDFGFKQTEAIYQKQSPYSDCGEGTKSRYPGYEYAYIVNNVTYNIDDCSSSLKTVNYLSINPSHAFSANLSPYVIVILFAAIGGAAIWVVRWFKRGKLQK